MSKQYKLLIVDDDPDIVEMYSMKFMSADFAVDVAHNGQEGVEMIRENTYDFVLLDIQMPVLDGFGVIAELKKENIFGKSKIMVLSNRGQKEDIEKCIQLGVSDCAIKANFTPSEILAKVQNRLAEEKK